MHCNTKAACRVSDYTALHRKLLTTILFNTVAFLIVTGFAEGCDKQELTVWIQYDAPYYFSGGLILKPILFDIYSVSVNIGSVLN